jgi:hypothetical protein
MEVLPRIWNHETMTSPDGDLDRSPEGSASGGRGVGRAPVTTPGSVIDPPSPAAQVRQPTPQVNDQTPPATYGRPRRQLQNEQGRRPQQGPLEEEGRRREAGDGNAWFPLTYAEMFKTLHNGQLSRRVALVPLNIIEEIRGIIRDPNSAIPRHQKELSDVFQKFERQIGADQAGPAREALRIGWRVAVMAGATVFWLTTLAGTLTMFAGVIGAAAWVVAHKQFFKTWREFDNTRALEAVKERQPGLRSGLQKPSKERSARVGVFVGLLALSPVAVISELAAQLGRNTRLRILKSRVETKRDQLDEQMNEERTRIENLAAQNRKSPIMEVPENIPPSPAAFDSYYYASNTPASRVVPNEVANDPVLAGGARLSNELDLQRRRNAGVSLP